LFFFATSRLRVQTVQVRGGEIKPSAPTKRLLKLAMERPELFRLPENRRIAVFPDDDGAFVHESLRAAHIDRLYFPLFVEPESSTTRP
jgi:hypothetical protein